MSGITANTSGTKGSSAATSSGISTAPAAKPPAAAAPASPADSARTAPVAASAPAATSAPAPSAVQPLSPPVKVKLGGSGIAAEGAFYIAMERGYFAEGGWTLTSRFSAWRRHDPAAGDRRLHLGGIGPDGSLFNAAGRDIELKIINHNSLVTPNDLGSVLSVRKDLVESGQYRERKDLKGMSIAQSTMGSSGQLFVERVLASAGLTPDDVNFVLLQVPDMNAAFANRAIDAAWHYEPFSSAARDQGVAEPVAPSRTLPGRDHDAGRREPGVCPGAA